MVSLGLNLHARKFLPSRPLRVGAVAAGLAAFLGGVSLGQAEAHEPRINWGNTRRPGRPNRSVARRRLEEAAGAAEDVRQAAKYAGQIAASR
jgi:hypothetical protein